MNEKEIQRSRTALHNAGTLEDRNDLRERLVARLRDDTEVLSEGKAGLQADFRRQLERWRTERVPESVPVRAIPSEVSDSRVYRVTAVFAMLAEMSLAAWVFWRLGVGWAIGALSACFLTLTLHGVFLQVFSNPERPKETVHRLKTLAALPAVIGFLVALSLGVLARYVYGALAVFLLPVFSLSLWLGTLSLLVLAASLFTMAHVLGWSRRYEKAYRKIDADTRPTLCFLKELEQSNEGRAAILPPSRLLPARVDGRSNGQESTASSILLLLVAVGWSLTACTTTATPHQSQREEQSSRPALHIMIDWSGSCVRAALEESWQTIRAELPAFIERRRLGSLTVAAFDEDGWCPRTVRKMALPQLALPTLSPQGTSEWDSFSNVREALRQKVEEEASIRTEGVLTGYRQELQQAIGALDATDVIPPPARQSRRSDIVGLLRRVSQTHSRRPEYFLVLTDVADTAQRELAPVAAPQGEVYLVVLIIPAEEREIVATIGKPLSGSEQFELRARQLREALPWAVSAPCFARNLEALFQPVSPAR